MPDAHDENGLLRHGVTQPVSALGERDKHVPEYLWVLNIEGRTTNRGIGSDGMDRLNKTFRGTFGSGGVFDSKKFPQAL